MNCKNSAQNAVKVAIFRLKIEKFSGEGANQTPPPLGRGTPPFQTLHPSILVPAALDLAPPPVCKSWIRHWLSHLMRQ